MTAGEPEVRAWTITEGTKAPQAAGKIHSDFERGFIRAEVVSYDDLIACGSHNAAKEKGLIRLEGGKRVCSKRRGYYVVPIQCIEWRLGMHRTIDFSQYWNTLRISRRSYYSIWFDIAYYGMLIGLGILAGIFIAASRSEADKAEDGRLL